MKKALFTALAALAFLSVTGCSTHSTPVDIDYYHAGEGYKWYYSEKDSVLTWTAGMPDTTVVATSTDYTVECTGQVSMDDGTISWEFKENAKDDTTYYYVKIGDVEVEFYSDKSSATAEFKMPVDLKLNSVWTETEGVSVGIIGTTTAAAYTVTGTEDVTIGSKTYTGALKSTATATVEVSGTSVKAEYIKWWDKDAGLIKERSCAETSVQGVSFSKAVVTRELIEFLKPSN